MFQDVRYAARLLCKNPGFTAIAVLSLAVGIGANSTVFSFVNAVIFKPLPVDDPGRLVWIYGTAAQSQEPRVFSYPDYQDFQAQTNAFSDVFGFCEMPLRLFRDGKPAVVWGASATENFFTGIRLKAAVGRTFEPEDGNTSDAISVAVIADSLWRRQFGGDPSVVGQEVRINDHVMKIVGVLPPEFSGTRAFGFIPEIWYPMAMFGQMTGRAGFLGVLQDRDNAFLFLMGRLKPGVSIAGGAAAVTTVNDRLNATYRKPSSVVTARVISGSHKVNPYIEMTGILQIGSVVTLAMVGFVLLIACANVANLMLVRVSGRRREVAVRLALGASRLRLIRQLLTESLMLSTVGGGVGLLAAVWLKDAITSVKPAVAFEVIESVYTFGLDWRIVGFTMLITLVAGILAGLTPALTASRSDINSELKGVVGGGTGRPRSRMRSGLVVVQVTLCIVLLVAGGLSLRSSRNVRNIDPGFSTSNLLMMRVNLGLQGYSPIRRQQFVRELRQRLEALPGILSASSGFPLPLDVYDDSRTIVPEGFVAGPGVSLRRTHLAPRTGDFPYCEERVYWT